eukprot:365441-Chlamydomonas_euryale.AAC.18
MKGMPELSAARQRGPSIGLGLSCTGRRPTISPVCTALASFYSSVTKLPDRTPAPAPDLPRLLLQRLYLAQWAPTPHKMNAQRHTCTRTRACATRGTPCAHACSHHSLSSWGFNIGLASHPPIPFHTVHTYYTLQAE